MKSQIKTPSLNKLNILYNDFHKKQTVDSISKPTPEYAYIKNQIKIIDDLAEEKKQVELRKLAQQIFADQLEREQSDKLWLYLSYGLGLFILVYMLWHLHLIVFAIMVLVVLFGAYHFIRFLMM